jgi:hypothetical protein
MAKRDKTSIQSSRYASSFWLDRDFDTDFKREGGGVDLAKLAAAQRAIGNFVNIVTGKQIPVVFQTNDSSYTDGERVVIGTKLEDKNFDPAVGLALHEGSHILLTDFNMFLNANKVKTSYLENTVFANIIRMQGVDPDMTMKRRDFEIIKDLLNWIEDRRIDYYIYTTAPGYRMYYEAMYNKYFNDKIIDKALKTNEKLEETWDDYFFHIINFTNPNRNLNALKSLKQIWSLVDLKNINRLKSTNDALLVAIEVYKTIKQAVAAAETQSEEDEDEESETKISGGGGGNGEDDSDVDDSDDDAAGEDDDETEGDEDESQGDGSGMSSKDQEKLRKAIEKQRDFLNDNAKKTGRITKKQASVVNALRDSGTEIRSVDTQSEGAGTANLIDTVVIKKLTPGIVCSLPYVFANNAEDYMKGIYNYETDLVKNTWRVRDIRLNDESVVKGIILGKQLGRKLQIRDSERTLKSTRLQSGKIDRRLVAQLGYDNVNVFHRIVTDRYKNYFIHISIDASGSMSGEKLRNSITSAVAVAQAASMTTGIRVQISLRGTTTLEGHEKCVTLYAYDSARDKMSKIRSMFKYLSAFGVTPEGVAFKSIEKDLRADAKGDECIFINYSDGEPTDIRGVQSSYDGVDYTRRVVNSYREAGINVISYFIYKGTLWGNTKHNFRKMYGPDAQFIDPVNMTQVSKTVNAKFLEMAD